VIAGRGLLYGGPQRRWGTVSFSLTGTMITVLTAELVLGVGLLFIFAIWLTANPDQMAWFEKLANLTKSVETPEALQPFLTELFQRPGIIPGMLLLLAVVVPFMEELIKPMALYFLLGRRLTPAQGFIGGLLCGACFALAESIGSMSMVTDPNSWVMLAIGRSGTALLHMTCTGLVGWGLASAFTHRRWGAFARGLLGAVALHGAWNAAAITQTISALQEGPIWKVLATASPILLGVIAMINLFILVKMNRQLQIRPDAPAVAIIDSTNA